MHNTHFEESDIASSSLHATVVYVSGTASAKSCQSVGDMLNLKMIWNICVVLVACCLGCTQLAMAQGAGSTAGQGIAHTSHDPGIWNFGFETQVCVMCHAPHNPSNASAGPLWNHAMSAVASYTMYKSPSTLATIEQPGPTSKLCLSCHDGTVAILAYGGTTTGMTMIDAYGPAGRPVIGQDLSNDHPIGFVYDAALVAKDSTKLKPTSTSVTIGASSTRSGTIASLLLDGGTKMECSSCHDVHNKFTVATANGRGLVKVSTGGSTLCVTCHIK
jgi:hypothetical protein